MVFGSLGTSRTAGICLCAWDPLSLEVGKALPTAALKQGLSDVSVETAQLPLPLGRIAECRGTIPQD